MKKYLLSAVVIFAFLFYSSTARNSPQTPSPAATLSLPGLNENNRNPSPSPAKGYQNGTYTGTVADAFYGNIQIAAVIQNGRLTNVNILQSPSDRDRSIAINSQALPILVSEAVHAQTASVDLVSGATDTSSAFINSLGSALSQASN